MPMQRLGLPLLLSSIFALQSCFTGASNSNSISEADAQAMLSAGEFDRLDARFSALQRQYGRGAITESKLRDAYRAFYPTDRSLAARYDIWVDKFPKSYAARLARAIYYRKVAGAERGAAYVDRTSATQLANMETALAKTTRDLDASFAMDSRPILSYINSIDVAGSLGAADGGRSYLDQAIRIEPKTLLARLKYMQNLQPRWGGSLEQMQAFLEECRTAGLPEPDLRTLEAMVVEESGWVHVHQDQDAAAAEQDFRRAESLDPNICSPCNRQELGNLLMVQKKYSEAIAVFTEALALKPDDINSLANRGAANISMGKAAEAVADWTRAGNAGDAYSQNELGRLYMLGIPGLVPRDPVAAIGWLRKAADQGDESARRNLAIALVQAAPR